MKIQHLRIHHFRSVRDLELNVADILILVGANNHGKSNILSAIEFALSAGAKPNKKDFFRLRDDADLSLWVEVTFGDLTVREREVLVKYVKRDHTVRVRKTARLEDDGAVAIAYNGYVEEPDEWWLTSGAQARLSTRDEVAAQVQGIPALGALLEGGGRITRQRIAEFQRGYIEAHQAELRFAEVLEADPLLGTRTLSGGVLPDFFLVPAVRDLGDETKIKTTTTFGRLLQRAVADMAERDERFAELRRELQAIVDALNARPDRPPDEASELARLEAALASELADWRVGVSIEVEPPDLRTVFELGTELHLDDGIKTPAEEKGHGLQRAALFALLRTWANSLRQQARDDGGRVRRAADSVLFAIEEPELFLHPHAQRLLFATLETIAAAPEHQVVVCTHSTHFVNLERYERVVVVEKNNPNDGTLIRQCTTDLFGGEGAADRRRRFHMAAWVNPDRGEIFFARKVILVEGETEKVVLPYLAKMLDCREPSVSVVDCGGKHNLPLYVAILNAFGIPYCVVHDEDPLPDPIPEDWDEQERQSKRRTFELNEQLAAQVLPGLGAIEILAPNFETVAGVPARQGKMKGKPLAALDHFEALARDDIPARLAAVARVGFGLEPQRAGAQ
jgi:CRISPR-associated exonuclease Cas4